MLIALQKNARTTPALRAEIAEIAASDGSTCVLAQRFGITDADSLQVEEARGLWRPVSHGASAADGAHPSPGEGGGPVAPHPAAALG